MFNRISGRGIIVSLQHCTHYLLPSNIRSRMRGLQRELNEFFAATSIHGFPYIHVSQTRCTRLLWTILVVSATAVASNFLYQTFVGYGTKGNRNYSKVFLKGIKSF